MLLSAALRTKSIALVLLYAAPACNGCDPYAQIERDAKRWPLLSITRPPGSACGPHDSASVRRARVHPLYPTGTWSAVAEFDVRRSLEEAPPLIPGTSVRAALMPVAQVFAGYLQAPTEGTLQARTYDDVYGAVYGGWAPKGLTLSPAVRPVFVVLGRSAWGDGGLRQVHEVCWIPYGTSEGVVVFSTAHPPPQPPLRLSQVYRTEDLGHRGWFNETLVAQLVDEFARDASPSKARALLDVAEPLLAALPSVTDGSTGLPIAPTVFYARQWVELLTMRLGLAVGRNDFDAIGSRLEALLSSPGGSRFCHGCERELDFLPLYRFVDARARKVAVPVPDEGALAQGAMGRNPKVIARFLRAGLPPKRPRLLEPHTGFWEGVKALSDGDDANAQRVLKAWLGAAPSNVARFETCAAAALIESFRATPGALNGSAE